MFDTLFDAPPAVGPPVQPLVTASAAEAADPGVLAAAQQARCTVYRGEVALLRAAALFADEHPVAEGSCGDGYAGTWHRVDGEERVMPLAGQGAPLVAEFAPAELGAVLGTSTEQARRLVGEALELRHRLPRIWARLLAGAAAAADGDLSGRELRRLVPVWLARQVAQATMSLPPEGAAHVDAHLAPFLHRQSRAAILRLVADARTRFDPDESERRALAAGDDRHVEVILDDPFLAGTGLASIYARTDLADAAALDATLDQVADQLSGLGHHGTRDVRRAAALGVLADPQWALDLLATDPHQDGASVPPPTIKREVVVYLHLHHAATSTLASASVAPVGSCEGVGALAAATIRDWMGRPDLRVSLRPVIDLNTEEGVDAYSPPARLAEHVILRDRTCRFPWCDRPARPHLTRRRGADLDHIEPYRPPGEGGPPGQTSTSGLAPLCRLHHRIKTHGRWRYRALRPGVYQWTSPSGHTYRVDRHGTEPD